MSDMTTRDREEVRTMLEDILTGWRQGYENHISHTNLNLEKIEKHLEKLNGKVAEHEKIIDQNLPHNISHCPQSGTIKNLEDNMITSKALKTYLAGSVTVIAAIFSVIYVIFEIILNKT